MLGARMVDGRVDEEMSRAARDVVAKIETVIPDALKHTLLETPLFAPLWVKQLPEIFDLTELRAAIRAGREVKIDYTDLAGGKSSRIIWPISIGLFPTSRIISAWCTKREDFRAFRTDRITRFKVLETPIGKRRAILLAEWMKTAFAMTGDPEKRLNSKITGVGQSGG
jgi:predicted DNA-binding transcriptional regulator YafY